MYKALITKVEKIRHQASNSEFLDVSFDILDADAKADDDGKYEVLESRRIGMDTASSKEDVVKEVNKHVVEHGRSVENAKLDAVRQKANANVKDMQENLVGSTITPKKEKVEEDDDSETKETNE